MSATRTFSATKYAPDHFQPEDTDPQTQRKVRGLLEQIDYTAFASNKAVIGHVLGELDQARLQKLAIASATARAKWVSEALALADAGPGEALAQAGKLAQLRTAYIELTEAYEGLRRMVERGYLAYKPTASA